MSCEDRRGHLTAADGVEAKRCAGLRNCVRQSIVETFGCAVDDMGRALSSQNLGLGWTTDHVHKRDAVSEAEPVQHLPEIGSGGGVNQGAMTLTPQGFGHAERGQRVDKGRRAILRRRSLGQRQAIARFHCLVSREASPKRRDRHRAPEQSLRGCSGLHHYFRAFVASRNGAVEPPGQAREGRALGTSASAAGPPGPPAARSVPTSAAPKRLRMSRTG